MGTWIRFVASVVGVLLTPGVYHALAIEVFTPKELMAVNGTSVRLQCTFKSTYPVTESSVSVSWSFKPLGQGAEELFFYYHEVPYPPDKGPFKGHAVWSGNVLKNDGSITLNDVQFNFNGTYACQVLNRPDVHGYTSEIRLEVVQTVKLSEIGILAAAVGGAILIILVILGIVLVVRYFRGRRGDAGIEMEDAKRGSVCAQAEFMPINRPEKELEKDKLQGELEKSQLREEDTGTKSEEDSHDENLQSAAAVDG